MLLEKMRCEFSGTLRMQEGRSVLTVHARQFCLPVTPLAHTRPRAYSVAPVLFLSPSLLCQLQAHSPPPLTSHLCGRHLDSFSCVSLWPPILLFRKYLTRGPFSLTAFLLLSLLLLSAGSKCERSCCCCYS